MFWDCNIERVAIENPISWYINKYFRKADQIIQPYYFGEAQSKATCLWLKNVPPLMYTLIHAEHRIYDAYYQINNPDRAKARSKTFDCIAYEMARQWGNL